MSNLNQRDALPVCKVAVIGAGYMAEEHLKAFTSLSNVQVTGIFSRTEAKARALAARYSIPTVYRSISELHKLSEAQLVVVTVPELSMREVACECFKYSWTVLLEKPAGYNLQDAQKIYDSALGSRAGIYVALNRRFYHSTVKALEDLSQISAPRFIHVQDQEDTFMAAKSGQPKEVVENWMFANSVHIIDYFKIFGRGPIKNVEKIFPWSRDVPQVVAAKIEFESGDIGLYQGIWRGPAPWAVQISTEEKRWEMRPLEKAFYQNKGERKLIELETDQADITYKPGLKRQAEEAVAAALSLPTKLVTLAESLETMKLVQAIFF